MNIHHDFSRLTLISSAGCNLSCKYCVIEHNKMSSEYSHVMQKNIIQAFKDNSFLENTKKIYSFFDQDYGIVKEIHLWGQEPTTTLSYLTEHLEDWLNTYYNCSRIFFSTNMGNKPDILFNFIKTLDNVVNKPFDLSIQISYDGAYSCQNQRNINPEIIKQNYFELIDKINNLVLQHVTVSFHCHGVINFETIYDIINNDQLLLDFIQDIDQTETNMTNCIHNIGCCFKGAGFVIEYPHDTSSIDGKTIVIFLQKIKLLSSNLNLNFPPIDVKLFQDLKYRTKSNFNIFKEIQKQLNISQNVFSINSINPFCSYMSCGVFNYELKITYDGILLDCLNNIFNTQKEYLNQNLSESEYNILKTFIDHNYYINPLIANKEEIQTIFKIYDNILLSFLTLYQSTINLMILLANSNQINIEYTNNQEKLLRHAYYLLGIQFCIYNRYIKSSSHYLSYIGVCRLYCNGLLDLLDEYLSEEK